MRRRAPETGGPDAPGSWATAPETKGMSNRLEPWVRVGPGEAGVRGGTTPGQAQRVLDATMPPSCLFWLEGACIRALQLLRSPP